VLALIAEVAATRALPGRLAELKRDNARLRVAVAQLHEVVEQLRSAVEKLGGEWRVGEGG
jgi:hypothetical protein